MKRQVYEIDENNFIKEIHLIDEEENTQHVTTNPPNGLYRAKWNGVEWIEDMTQEEIDELNNAPKELTETEMLMDYVVDVDFRVVMLELGL